MNPSSDASSRPRRIVIASRKSALALWQAEHIQQRLNELYPDYEVAILGMTTTGDRILDTTLSKIGGKGLFVKELEQALLEGEADIAVHSMKDVPMQLPDGFTLAAITEREDPRDAFVSNDYPNLGALPAGAVVGTSSLRREAQLRARYPHLLIQPLRGNVGTRLKKLDEGQYAAIILAVAGLKRLGLENRIAAALEPEDSLPAVGQGALGIEIRADRSDLVALLRPLVHEETSACVSAERAMSRVLGGSCQVPIGGYAEVRDGVLHLRAFVAHPDGSRILRAEASGATSDAEQIGAAVALELRNKGADAVLAAAAT